MDAVRFDRATLGYRGRCVLHGISLGIAQGEFIGVLGANGSGKTTLLRAILGLVPPQSGGVEVFGTPATRGNRVVGYMPQVRAAIGGQRLVGAAYVASAAAGGAWGLPWLGAAARREADWALELVGATELARRPLAELSGGERQRLLLAQALLGRPRLLLLDEPLASLDPRHRQGIVALVRRLQVELGLTVLFSAHELNPILTAMDRVLVLGGGIAALGTVDEVVTGPVLSRLYDAEVEVIRTGNRVFVMVDGAPDV